MNIREKIFSIIGVMWIICFTILLLLAIISNTQDYKINKQMLKYINMDTVSLYNNNIAGTDTYVYMVRVEWVYTNAKAAKNMYKFLGGDETNE